MSYPADLLMVEPHTPTPEPVKYDKKDGQWYTHDGVDVEDTQQRKGTNIFWEKGSSLKCIEGFHWVLKQTAEEFKSRWLGTL